MLPSTFLRAWLRVCVRVCDWHECERYHTLYAHHWHVMRQNNNTHTHEHTHKHTLTRTHDTHMQLTISTPARLQDLYQKCVTKLPANRRYYLLQSQLNTCRPIQIYLKNLHKDTLFWSADLSEGHLVWSNGLFCSLLRPFHLLLFTLSRRFLCGGLKSERYFSFFSR
jgi:hypothetical protein